MPFKQVNLLEDANLSIKVFCITDIDISTYQYIIYHSNLISAIWVCLKIWYIPNEIAIFHRDNDQQNHWVFRGTQHFQTHPYQVGRDQLLPVCFHVPKRRCFTPGEGETSSSPRSGEEQAAATRGFLCRAIHPGK